ncbi:MAG: glycosyltransferase [Candidatus Solibacter usitatus]|nr:glycosyltransferase [Candidatus Solibacter usitatus]
MADQIKVAFLSGSDDLNSELIRGMRALFPDLPLYVVSEFPPPYGRWIPYHVSRGFFENWACCRAAWRGKRIRLAGVLLVPRVPYRRMRLMALLASPVGFVAFNENLDSFMLRPRDALTIPRHLLWRAANFVRWQTHPGGGVYTFFWRLRRPDRWRPPLLRWGALLAGRLAALARRAPAPPLLDPVPRPPGISVVIPSRNGRHLLEPLLPAVLRDLEGIASEVIVVDNGSDDGTAGALPAGVRVESSPAPLSFARAVNRGIAASRYSRVCLLNNDMAIEPGFFLALLGAFAEVPGLFCATAQIFLPAGARREETGKAVMARLGETDFPIRCELPIDGEDLSYVLYGSGGCSLYDASKLRALGGVGEVYEPAYCEDLDLGYRAWQRGWPSVFVAGARVEHRHRATTSRYYSREQLDAILEINYLRFLCRAVASRGLFLRLWREAVERLYRLSAWEALGFAWRAPELVEPASGDESFLDLVTGGVAVFPGRARRDKPVILVVSPYLPYPLAHGGAVRMYNLMSRAARDYTQVLVAFGPSLETPPQPLLDLCAEIVLVKHQGRHSRPSTERPDVVEDFDSPAFHAALRQTARKWRPRIAQLEFTQMAQYVRDCRPAPAILVEHDLTLDLYEQLARLNDDWQLRRQLAKWRSFETAAWRKMDCVVTMSVKDRARVQGARAETIANGVDLDRFRPGPGPPDARRLLFIGSFAHLPNLLALDYFLREVWPRLRATLHVIAGARHEYFLEFYHDRVQVDLARPGIELEGFVADVRPAYERATLVIAPLVVSAGTNVKILEAMAMGKAIVSTPAGVNGLDLDSGSGVVIVESGERMTATITALLEDPARRRELEVQARATAEQRFSWDHIADRQRALYLSLLRESR